MKYCQECHQRIPGSPVLFWDDIVKICNGRNVPVKILTIIDDLDLNKYDDLKQLNILANMNPTKIIKMKKVGRKTMIGLAEILNHAGFLDDYNPWQRWRIN